MGGGMRMGWIQKRLPFLAGVLSSLVFGFNFLAARICMTAFGGDTVRYVAFRQGLAFAFMALLVALHLKKVSFRGKPGYAMIALLLSILFNPILCQWFESTATLYAPVSQISLFTSLMPLGVVLLSALVNREIPTRRQAAFMAVSLAGVLCIQMVDGAMEGSSPLGTLLIFLSLLSVSVQRVLFRRASLHFTAFDVSFLSAGVAGGAFMLFSLGDHGLVQGDLPAFFQPFFQHPELLPALVFTSIIACALGGILVYYAAANLPIAVSAATSSLMPLTGVLAGVVFLQETLRPIDVAGIALILCGTLGMSLSYRPENTEENRFNEARLRRPPADGAEKTPAADGALTGDDPPSDDPGSR